MMKKFFVFFLLAVMAGPTITLAASNNKIFTITSGIYGDVIPPTTPTLTSVTAIDYDQIDITWTAATDNVQVDGYQLFRDGVAIATTSQTNYTDTGLSGSTTYSYYVRAFDISGLYSSTSNSLAAMTSGEPTPPPPIAIIEDTRVTVSLLDISIKTGSHQAAFAWSTKGHAQYLFRWGRTTSYELGYVTTDTFKRSHKTLVTDLEPATTYEYELIGYDRRGNEYELSRGQFITDEAPDTTAPTNVANLKAEVIGEDVRLSWDNPLDTDFSHVKILRSYLFYPLDQNDGFIVYQGADTSVLDRNAFLFSPDQFYTVFSYDTEGNISSGAVIFVNKFGNPSPANDSDNDGANSSSTTFTFDDLNFVQNGKAIEPNQAGRYVIDGNSNLTVMLPYELLPEHLKAITVTFVHPDDSNRLFSFMLRINKDKTAYEATLSPLETSGLFTVLLDVFDFKQQKLSRVTGEVLSLLAERVGKTVAASFQTVLEKTFGWSMGILLFVLVLGLLTLLKKLQPKE